MTDPSKYFATSPVNMIYSISEALEAVLDEGLEERFRRHHTIAEAFRTAIDALSLRILADRECMADTLTVVYYPENIEDVAFRNEMRRRGIVVAPTMGVTRGKGFRVGHMGNVRQDDIILTIDAIEGALERFNHIFRKGAGLATAQEKLHPNYLGTGGGHAWDELI